MQTREHDETSSAFLAGEDKETSSDGRSQESESELQRYDEEEIVTKPWPPQTVN
jgi:hypothetical protein